MFIWNNQENLEQETNTSGSQAASAGGFRLICAFVVKGRRTLTPQLLWEGNQWHWFPACSNEAWWVKHVGLEPTTTHLLDDLEQILQPHLPGSDYTLESPRTLQIIPMARPCPWRLIRVVWGRGLGISVFISTLVILSHSQAEQCPSRSVPPWRQKSYSVIYPMGVMSLKQVKSVQSAQHVVSPQ